jgi:hypothetical protein
VKSSGAVAEAELDVLRAQRFRLDLLQGVIPGRATAWLAAAPELVHDPIRPDDGAIFRPDRQNSAGLRPAENAALTFADITKQLELADRYERRASSRRKFAIRDFDALRNLQINDAEKDDGRRAAEKLWFSADPAKRTQFLSNSSKAKLPHAAPKAATGRKYGRTRSKGFWQNGALDPCFRARTKSLAPTTELFRSSTRTSEELQER